MSRCRQYRYLSDNCTDNLFTVAMCMAENASRNMHLNIQQFKTKTSGDIILHDAK